MLRSVEGSDTCVQGTNDDAQVSKLSCSKAGYFRDEFIQFFVRRASRRSPLINRGYYSRHYALRTLLKRFLAAAQQGAAQHGPQGAPGDAQHATQQGAAQGAPTAPQVLVLGAGFDTTWFQLRREGHEVPYSVLELDFKEVTSRKAAIIAQQPALRAMLEPGPGSPPAAAAAAAAVTAGGQAAAVAAGAPADAGTGTGPSPADGPAGAAPAPAPSAASPSCSTAAAAAVATGGTGSGPGPAGGLHIDAAAGEVVARCPPGGGAYVLLPCDLRDLAALDRALERAGWDRSAPTYVLSECVLVYLDPRDSAQLVGWAARTFANAVMAIYEQIRPDDAFGRQMVSNLEARGCPLRGLPATPTLQAHRERLLGGGWAWADAQDMDTLYLSIIPPHERQRAERLELFDELEEWHMIQEHYCISVGRNDAAGWLSGVDLRPAEGS